MTQPKVSVTLHLTPFAPDVARVAIGDQRRWMALWSVAPVKAMAEVAQRLRVHPSRLSIHEGAGPPGDHDDIEIRGPASGHAGDQVLALIAAGLSGPQARAALAELQAAISRQPARAA